MLSQAPRTLVCLVVGLLAALAPPAASQDFPPVGTIEATSRILAVSDDYIVSASGGIAVFDRTTFEPIGGYSPPGGASSVAIQGDLILSAGSDTVTIYSVSQGQIVQTVTRPGEVLSNIAANSERFLVRSDNNGVVSDHLYLNSGTLVTSIPIGQRPSTNSFTGREIALTDKFGLLSTRQPGGAALVINPATGQVIRTLRPTNDDGSVGFGNALAIHGNIAIIGDRANTEPGDTVTQVGAAYVFDLTTGQQLHKFRNPTEFTFQRFGESVALCDDFYLIGVPGDRVLSVPFSGTAHLYRRSDGLFLGRLIPSQILNTSLFGRAVALHAGLPFVGSGEYNQTHWYRAGAAGFAQQPVSQVVAANAAAVMQVVLFDDTDVAFQWYLNGKPVVDGPNFQGANTAVLNITARPEAAGIYECFVTRDDLLPVTSSQAVLTVLADPNACYADANNDGQLNFFDIARYIQLFNAGCP